MLQIVKDATSTANFTSASSCSWSHTIGAGNNPYLLVGAGGFSTNAGLLPVTGVTINGIALTKIGECISSYNSDRNLASLWYLPGNLMPPPGTYTIVVTYSGSISDGSCIATSFFNVKPAAPEASTTVIDSQSSANPISGSITTLTDNAMCVGFEDGEATGFAPNQGQTVFGTKSSATTNTQMDGLIKAVAGAQTMSYGLGNNASQCMVLAALTLKAPVGGMLGLGQL